MLDSVTKTGTYNEYYAEFAALSYMRSFLGCCFKNKDWFKAKIKKLERHEKAVEAVNEELDIVK
jgi:hypothetical protein